MITAKEIIAQCSGMTVYDATQTLREAIDLLQHTAITATSIDQVPDRAVPLRDECSRSSS
jgi:hypothetical protein